jgi:fructuronate reductase
VRLGRDSLALLPAAVGRPSFAPEALAVGIVHLGIGAFHRAHQAAYTQEALGVRFGPWGICGVSLRSPDTRDRLAAQDHLFTLIERDGEAARAGVIAAVRETLFAPADPAAVIDRIAAPETQLVTLTVTEKGYCLDRRTGELDQDHPDIRHDLASPAAPRSAIGYLVRGLARRRAGQGGPLTLLSCDNLPANGRALERAVTCLAGLVDPALERWILDRVAFPGSMVDRIVPASTAETARLALALTGFEDQAALACESFRQWVVEDRFAAGRPAWEAVGVELVGDVAPYETMKIRLLNGSHSTIAYLGYLAGYQTVAEAMRDADLRDLIWRLMTTEIAPTLAVPAGSDVTAYMRRLLERFSDPGLAHRTWQIAMDGSQKLPQRLLGTIAQCLDDGRPIACLALAVAAWMRYVGGRDEAGRPIDVVDPLADRLTAIGRAADGDAAALVDRYGGIEEIFGELGRRPEFKAAVAAALGTLIRRGAKAAVAELLEQGDAAAN